MHPLQFPRLVYKSPSEYKQVIDIDEFNAEIASGWYNSVLDATAPRAETSRPEKQKKIRPQIFNAAQLEI